jgi:WD40 repeat protein
MKRFIFTLSIILLMGSCGKKPSNAISVSDYPIIFPDYINVTIPYNIAPLNFKLSGSFKKMYVEVEGKNILLTSKNKRYADFDLSQWKKLLHENAGGKIEITVYAKNDKSWIKFRPFSIFIKKDCIDPFLSYRLIAPGYQVWSSMGIYQRSLENFKEKEIITNRLFPGTCMNCHSFKERDHERMLLHVRGGKGGTFISNDSKLIKINSKPDDFYSGFQYPCWHPEGRYIAFSINQTAQVFHTVKDKRIEVFDSKSDIVVYDTNENKAIIDNKLMSPDWFETFPTFSPDGKYLYFCSSQAKEMPAEFDKVKYNLCRIEFDAQEGRFGSEVDTLVRVVDTNGSVSFPRSSPDGKFLLFTLSDYGNFSIWHQEADLYLLDLMTGKYWFLHEVNSDNTESYHSWSSNSRWIVFSSRRVDGLYTMPFFAWIDENGRAEKPFLLPQKDPEFYSNTFYSFNIPEFVDGRVFFSVKELEKAYNMEGKKVDVLP